MWGQVGNGTDYVNNVSGDNNVYTPTSLQFCTRCQRCVELGSGGPTSGILTAQCNGTLYLYFNGEIGKFANYSGSYTATINGVTTNVPAHDIYGYGIGVAVGTVTIGNVYTYSASGYCTNTVAGVLTDPDGRDSITSNLVNCSNLAVINKTNAVCPMWQCFSLVGKIQ
jgi:hypothetical protein